MNVSNITASKSARALTIYFVKKDDAGLSFSSLFKQQPELPFSLTDPFTQCICTLSHVECNFAALGANTVGQGPCQQRFTCPRGSVEEDTPWRHDVKTLENLGVKEWKGNHLFQLVDMPL